jgi:hypothetical protein
MKSLTDTNVRIGSNSENVTQSLNCVSIGNSNGNQASNKIAIGDCTDRGDQNTDAICINWNTKNFVMVRLLDYVQLILEFIAGEVPQLTTLFA